jgi:hypothetical protein
MHDKEHSPTTFIDYDLFNSPRGPISYDFDKNEYAPHFGK